jgi:hypothetical protein
VFFLWSVAPLITIFNAIRLGFETMTSQGDSQKLGELKEKGRNLLLSLVFIFGSWLIVTALINILGVRDPNLCFPSNKPYPTGTIVFQFVFPTPCP